MSLLSSIVWIYPLVLSATLFHVGDVMTPRSVPQKGKVVSSDRQIRVVVLTDRAQYSMRDVIKVHAAVQNNSDKTTYVDRRIYWGGLGGGFKLEIRNDQGKALPARFLSDAPLPPPEEGDTSILVRLEPGFLYGTYVYLKVKDFFPKAGRYSLRVAYGSWLHRENVAPQLRNLPALWAYTPVITSEPVWIHVKSPGRG